MPRALRKDAYYQRSPYWLGHDTGKNGQRRCQNYVIFWYDKERGRVRSISTGTIDIAKAREALDRHYYNNFRGHHICITCGQHIAPESGILVLRAISDYLLGKATASSISAIRPRLAHVVAYIATLPSPSVTCEDVSEKWVEGFRLWMKERPIVATSGKELSRTRALSTVENSVLQLAAAINATRNDGKRAAKFKPIPGTELNRTPTKRLSFDDLAEAFRYASDPRYPTKRAALHRFLILSVATLARPDAVHDYSTDPVKQQWDAERHVVGLNPQGRRQTRKFRATVIAPRQLAKLLKEVDGFWIPGVSVRSAWRTMCVKFRWPGDGQAGMKLIRRSVAQLLRDAGTPRGWNEVWREKDNRVLKEDIEVQLGHRRIKTITDIYAPFEPDYLDSVTQALEALIDAIIERVPNAFTLSSGEPIHKGL